MIRCREDWMKLQAVQGKSQRKVMCAKVFLHTEFRIVEVHNKLVIKRKQ